MDPFDHFAYDSPVDGGLEDAGSRKDADVVAGHGDQGVGIMPARADDIIRIWAGGVRLVGAGDDFDDLAFATPGGFVGLDWPAVVAQKEEEVAGRGGSCL